MNSYVKYVIGLCFLPMFIEAQTVGYTASSLIACQGSSIKFTDISTPPTGASITMRRWFFGSDSVTTTVDTLIYYFSKKGQQSVTLMVFFSDGTDTNTTGVNPIDVKGPPTASLSPDYHVTCAGMNQTIIFSLSSVVGDGILTEDSIDIGDGQNYKKPDVPFNSANKFYLYPGKYFVTYKVGDQYGCNGYAYDTITIVSPPEVLFVPLNLSCKDSSVLYENRTKNAKKFQSFTWQFYDSVAGGFVYHSGKDTTVYTWRKAGPQWMRLWGVDSNNCSDTSDILDVNVDTTPILQVDKSVDTTICFGESIKYTITGANKLRWKDFKWADTIVGDSSIVVVTPKNTFTYTVYGITQNCPPSAKDIKIRVVPPIETKVVLTPDTILKGNKAILELNTNVIYDSMYWQPDSSVKCRVCDSTLASPIVHTTYIAKIFYSLGNYQCSTIDSGSVYVNTDCDRAALKIPTGFTPNSDLMNDIFYLKAFNVKSVLEMSVFNRWGNEVFHTIDVSANVEAAGWNGRMNNTGDDLPPGLYIYNISAKCYNEQIINFQGEINLLR